MRDMTVDVSLLVGIPEEVEHGIRRKWNTRFRRKWNSESGKWNTESGGSGTSIPEEVEQRFRRS